jgi:peroxiredoxin family protein
MEASIAGAGTRHVVDPLIQALEKKVQDLERRISTVEGQVAEDRVTLVVFSGDLDRVLAAFLIATGAAAMGQQVSMFFTFWGLSVLKRDSQLAGKTLFQKMMAVMTPESSKGLPVSSMNYFGIGAKMLRSMMKEKNVSSLEELIALARELGVRMISCEMSRDLMGIRESELVSGLECGGVASFLADSLKSRTSLFI